jgi:hypothetical protein
MAQGQAARPKPTDLPKPQPAERRVPRHGASL